MTLCKGSEKHGNETWVRWERREDCAYRLGTNPDDIMVGLAISDRGDPGVVIWPPSGEPVFIESRYAHLVQAAAMEAATIRLAETFDEWEKL